MPQYEENGHPVGNIGRNISVVGEGAFRNCNQLDIICLGSNILEIRDFEFEGCVNLVRVCIKTHVAPYLGTGAFENVSGGLKIFVPAGSVGYETQEWEDYIIEYVNFLLPD